MVSFIEILKNNLFLIISLILFSCKYEKPACRFSNFDGTKAVKIVQAIKDENIDVIRKEIKENRVDIDYKDLEYEVSLLSLALVNNKKQAFQELLKLGANPNVNNSYCVSPLISAIRNNKKCDLSYIELLLENGANITPKFFRQCNFFSYDPITETIQHYSDEEEISCGLKILKLLTAKLNNPNLLFMYNNSEEYQANVLYICLSTQKNISALKYLIVDLGYKFPEKIFIDGTVITNYSGFYSLEDILKSDELVFEYSKIREQAKNDILNYLNKQK